MTVYTGFCQEVTGKGTIWIGAIEADTQDEAINKARAECAVDWTCHEEDIHVLGLAEGDVNILVWEDIDE